MMMMMMMIIDDDDENGHHQVREVGRLVIRDSAFLSLPMGAILIHSADQVIIAFIILFSMIINTSSLSTVLTRSLL